MPFFRTLLFSRARSVPSPGPIHTFLTPSTSYVGLLAYIRLGPRLDDIESILPIIETMSAKPIFHGRHLPSGILDQMHSRVPLLPAAKSYTTEHTPPGFHSLS